MKLYIPRDRECHGIQILGVKGSRKSSIIRRMVYQAYERRIPCVFLDQKRDYLEEFYQEGDHLIDFGDTRGVRWMTSREAIDEPHAMAMSEAAYPDKPGQQFFFQDHARAIMAYLIGVHHPRTSELARWIAKPDVLDSLLKGTEHAETLTRNSPEQRAGIIGTLSHIGRTLRWLPDNDGDREFSVTEYCQKKRKGNIFLSSSPYNFPALRPLHSMIFDMLLLGVQTYPGEMLFIGDEIGVFPRCPQLGLSAAMIRSSGAVVILAYQSYSQLQDTYGEKMADTISSNNWATIVLRNSSPASAEHCSKLLGMPQEVERIRESKSPWSLLSRRVGRTYSEERPMIYPVTAGEVQSQKDGRGWISAEGKIARIKVKYLEPVIRAPRLIERIVPAPIVEDEPIQAIPKPKSKYVQRRLKTA